MKKITLILLVILLASVLLKADVYIRTRTRTEAFEMMGEKIPTSIEYTEEWIGEKKFAWITKNRSILLDLSTKKICILSNKNKTYLESSLPLDLSNLLPQQAKQMLETVKVEFKVIANREISTIKSRDCSRYDVEMEVSGSLMQIQMNMQTWATKEVPFDWKFYRDNLYPYVIRLSSPQLSLKENEVSQFKKINGFRLMSEISLAIMDRKIKKTEEVLDIIKKTAPEGIYSVPPDFIKKKKFSLTDLQQRQTPLP